VCYSVCAERVADLLTIDTPGLLGYEPTGANERELDVMLYFSQYKLFRFYRALLSRAGADHSYRMKHRRKPLARSL
jgi:hypothetical protein